MCWTMEHTNKLYLKGSGRVVSCYLGHCQHFGRDGGSLWFVVVCLVCVDFLDALIFRLKDFQMPSPHKLSNPNLAQRILESNSLQGAKSFCCDLIMVLDDGHIGPPTTARTSPKQSHISTQYRGSQFSDIQH